MIKNYLSRRRAKRASDKLSELGYYTKDLEKVMFLRDKATDEAEIQRYSNIIKCMQLAMERVAK
jgi:hypothetical protein